MSRTRTLVLPCSLAMAGALLSASVGTATAATATATTTGTSTLSVLAFNVDLATSAVDSAKSENAAGRTPAVEAVIREHDADVVILDELFNQTSSDQIPADLAAQYPYHTPNIGQVCSGGGWDSISGDCSTAAGIIRGGTMILSKYPIMAQHAYVFENAVSWDWFSNKGAVLAEIDKNGTRSWVVGTHLQADQAGTSVDTTRATRVEQMGEIKNWVNATVGTQGPVLMGGDLNIEYFNGQVGRAPGDSDLDRASAAGSAVLHTVEDPNAPVRTLDCDVGAWCKTMSGIESFPSTYDDSLDYLGYLNDTDASGTTRPVPAAVAPVQVLFDPQPGWANGQLDTYAPSDHYPVMTTFTIGRTNMPAVDWKALDSSGGDDNLSLTMQNRPDWDPGALKATCLDGERLAGLSYGGDRELCTDATSTTAWDAARDVTVVHGETYVSTDWASGYTKAQCPQGSVATGYSRNGDTIGVLCAKSAVPLGTATRTVWFNGGDNRPPAAGGGDFAPGDYKGQCADDEYVAGVAYSHPWWQSWAARPYALLCQKLA
ncbi:sphingomyelin phosphodiesterase [Kitasatospora sp. NBC_01266]|uniref:sphingomyelin phosphodiesterase n=1 Tax=Kitasatospora sp. NBC_01266 TaxID=2903572 RepID=UPI002E31A4C0|nr:sphingomyelin phosphodiesterase [Kitasatospora sp. NBC_01266]